TDYMGQILTRRQYEDLLIDGLAVAAVSNAARQQSNRADRSRALARFRDLSELPPELALAILSHLGPTDLCLAACVWGHLANDELLWQALCKNAWAYCTAYSVPGRSYRQLYLRLDEASLSFNADCFDGFACFLRHEILIDEPGELALFFHGARVLDRRQVSRFMETRPDVLDKLMERKSFENQFLPNALRKFFNEVEAPNARNEYLSLLLDRFSLRFVASNPGTGLSKEMVFILCYSLILLSVDLCSPHVKNKMSKREFIRNTRRATTPISDDFLGHLYDNIYLVGHVAPTTACSY
ncbi:hypothetical protein BOX15_Mlig011094g2, partial [Macrostomum lignano]